MAQNLVLLGGALGGDFGLRALCEEEGGGGGWCHGCLKGRLVLIRARIVRYWVEKALGIDWEIFPFACTGQSIYSWRVYTAMRRSSIAEMSLEHPTRDSPKERDLVVVPGAAVGTGRYRQHLKSPEAMERVYAG